MRAIVHDPKANFLSAETHERPRKAREHARFGRDLIALLLKPIERSATQACVSYGFAQFFTLSISDIDPTDELNGFSSSIPRPSFAHRDVGQSLVMKCAHGL